MRSRIPSGALSLIAVLIYGLYSSEKQDQPIEIKLQDPGNAFVIKLN
ncbi:MAG: hypothetical protein VX776_04895 [Planctomycetota bacterium]|nr:hypothetical protein [Planctomycetota bacterium]